MTTIQLSKEMKSYLTSVKVFVSKAKTRPVLTAALVNEKYIIATDSHRLIRITHNQEVDEQYLHYYKANPGYNGSSYPDTSRLMPNPSDAKQEFTLDVKEWLEAHESGLVAAKEHEKNNPITLKENKLHVKESATKKGKYIDPVNRISFTYTLDKTTELDENITYNCKFMIDALKVFKKFKHKEVKVYFYGTTRPFLLVAGNIEVLILPIRTY